MRKIFQALFCGCLLWTVLCLFGCSKDCSHGSMAESVVHPTCDREGYTLHICENCDYEYKTDVLPPTGHTLTQETTAPTCTEEGYTTYTCSCGYYYKGSFLAPTGHSYASQTVDPTCEEEGYIGSVCSVCSHTVKTKLLSATGHTLASETVEPGCTEQGYTQYSCSSCELSYRANFVEALGHSLRTTQILHPTHAENGTIQQHCANCEYSFTNYLLYNDVYTNAYVAHKTVLAKGVDISYYNHTPKNSQETEHEPLDWAAIKAAGFDFAILRAGYTGMKDPVFEMDYTDAKVAGMDLGVYYYSYAKNAEQALEEAEELIGWLSGKQFEYPIYFDIEHSSCLTHPTEAEETADQRRDRLTDACIAFIDALRDAGYYGALYSNNYWLTNYLDAETLKEYGELWYARYPRDPYQKEEMSDEEFKAIKDAFEISATDDEFVWNTQKYGGQVGLWQYTESGVIENFGMDQKVDFNYAFKDYPAMMKKFCLNGYTAEP